MAEEPKARSAAHTFSGEELTFLRENLTELKRTVSEPTGFLYVGLATGFLVGLAAHVSGFLLRESVTTELARLAADLLYALGWSLWTSAVVVVFVQVIPDVKRRQLKRYLEAYEAAQGD